MTAARSCSVTARAKLNLALRVLAREQSGFHQIETLFCALELADDIVVTLRDEPAVTLDVQAPADAPGEAPDIGPADSNLAVRAARAYLRHTGRTHGVHIALTKQIPAGAGLGGGSSDAAAVLTALNTLCEGAVAAADLVALGGELGSDVPFFLSGSALALAWGRGNRMLPLSPLPSAAVVLAVPSFGVDTGAAYAALAAARGDRTSGAAVVTPPRSWVDVAALSVNDFEDVVFAQHAVLRTVRQLLDDNGACIARLTGSGSVVYGIFDDVASAERAAAAVQAAHADVRTRLTRTAESLQ